MLDDLRHFSDDARAEDEALEAAVGLLGLAALALIVIAASVAFA